MSALPVHPYLPRRLIMWISLWTDSNLNGANQLRLVFLTIWRILHRSLFPNTKAAAQCVRRGREAVMIVIPITWHQLLQIWAIALAFFWLFAVLPYTAVVIPPRYRLAVGLLTLLPVVTLLYLAV